MKRDMGLAEFAMTILGVIALLDWVVMPMVSGLSPSMSSEWRKDISPTPPPTGTE